MDLSLWTEHEPSGRIHPGEFYNPERMAERLVIAIGTTRVFTKCAMRMSRSRDGTRVFHPNGDAAAFSDGHSGYSLHYFGIDHARSKIEDEMIEVPNADGLAVDFDFAAKDPNYLFDLYLKLERVKFDFPPYRWNGIGAYAHWRLGQKANPGFHVDLRSLDHPGSGARWMRTESGSYIPLTWKTWRREFKMTVV